MILTFLTFLLFDSDTVAKKFDPHSRCWEHKHRQFSVIDKVTHLRTDGTPYYIKITYLDGKIQREEKITTINGEPLH